MDSVFKVATFNVNGIADKIKRREIFHYCHKLKFDIVLLQETHSMKSEEKWWRSQWGGQILFSHGTSSSCGVAILISRRLSVTIHNLYSDTQGRFIIVYATINSLKIAIASMYAPCADTPTYFQKFFEVYDPLPADFHIFGGDLNLALNVQLDRTGSLLNNINSANWLNNHLDLAQYVDIWRFFKPDENGFTWRRLRPSPTFSRIDYLLTSTQTVQLINNVKIFSGFRSDHSIVSFDIILEYQKRGPGYWKFNTTLLSDPDYVQKINNLLDIELAQDYDSYKNHWEIIKLAIRNSTLQFSARKSKSNKNKIAILERQLRKLENELASSQLLFEDTEQQILLVKQELRDLIKQRTRGAILRSHSNWALEGERSSKYFLNLEKSNYHRKTIYRLTDESGLPIETPKEILSEIRTYYEKLYTSKGFSDPSYTDNLTIPRLSEEISSQIDEQISIAEISAALKNLNNNKCPGIDGLPAELYKVFWNKIKDFVHGLFLEIVATGQMPLSMRQSVISLLEKPGKNPTYLKSWRPLSLLNVDNKLFGKVLANRLQIALQALIHPSQTGFIKNRQLADNIHKILSLIDNCETTKEDGFLISFDFEKAFDHLEWTAIDTALDKFGFGPHYKDMVHALFANPVAYTSNNGYWAQPIFPSRGCRQGCTYSPGIFVLTVELLGISIRQNKDIQGFDIKGTCTKAGQFADDLWSLLKNIESVNAILRELEYFYAFSGLKINSDKCVVLKSGPPPALRSQILYIEKINLVHRQHQNTGH